MTAKAQSRVRAMRTSPCWLALICALALTPGCRSPWQVVSGEAQMRKARIYLETGRPVFARAEYVRAKRKHSDNPKLFRRFGAMFARFGQWEDAARAYEESLKIEPDAQTAVVLAEVYWSAPPYGIDTHADLIESTLGLAISLDPKHPGALNNLAYFYAERKERLDYALELSRKSIRLSPTTPAYLDTLGWIYYRMGQPAKALPLLGRAVELDRHNYELREHLAACFERLGDTKRAHIERAKARLLSREPPA